jgi:DNA-binding SARP family transcriptional activator
VLCNLESGNRFQGNRLCLRLSPNVLFAQVRMIQIQLFERFGLWRDGVIIPVKSQPVRELLCYLLLHQGHELSREMLATALWADRCTAQSLKTLRQTLWQLQSVLTENELSSIQLHDREYPQLELDASVHLDADRVTGAYEQVKHGGPLLEMEVLRQAVGLYRGPLLEGWTQEWCLIERERFAQRYVTVLDALLEHCLAQRCVAQGLEYAQQILNLETARECTHRQVMQLHLLAGDRTSALRQFERCAQALETEFGVQPAASTVAIMRQARSTDDLKPADLEPERVVPVASLDVISVLQQIQQTLQELVRRFDRTS